MLFLFFGNRRSSDAHRYMPLKNGIDCPSQTAEGYEALMLKPLYF
jgi:hypothetical protein